MEKREKREKTNQDKSALQLIKQDFGLINQKTKFRR
jgi:hypothetical protein